jgi:hypothetical protein
VSNPTHSYPPKERKKHQTTKTSDVLTSPAWAVAFERSLEIHETVETDRQNRANKQMESLTGNNLQRAKDSNEERKRQY